MPELINSEEKEIYHALKPFGWACTEEFWVRYYSDPWVFNLVNSIVHLTRRLET